jgi:hypothetical protein
MGREDFGGKCIKLPNLPGLLLGNVAPPSKDIFQKTQMAALPAKHTELGYYTQTASKGVHRD